MDVQIFWGFSNLRSTLPKEFWVHEKANEHIVEQIATNCRLHCWCFWHPRFLPFVYFRYVVVLPSLLDNAPNYLICWYVRYPNENLCLFHSWQIADFFFEIFSFLFAQVLMMDKYIKGCLKQQNKVNWTKTMCNPHLKNTWNQLWNQIFKIIVVIIELFQFLDKKYIIKNFKCHTNSFWCVFYDEMHSKFNILVL